MITAAILPDEMLLHDAAQMAVAQHLHLVITRQGTVVLTPILLPGMQKIAVRDKSLLAQPQRQAA